MSPPPRRAEEEPDGDETDMAPAIGHQLFHGADDEDNQRSMLDNDDEDEEEDEDADGVGNSDPASNWNDYLEDEYGEDYGDADGDEDWGSEMSSSEASDDVPTRCWPDPFDEGTEASSAPRSRSSSSASAEAPSAGQVRLTEDLLQAATKNSSLSCWHGCEAEGGVEAVSYGLKVICLPRLPEERAEASSAPPACVGDFRIAPQSYWSSLHSLFPRSGAEAPAVVERVPECVHLKTKLAAMEVLLPIFLRALSNAQERQAKAPAPPRAQPPPTAPATAPAFVPLQQPEIGGSSSSSCHPNSPRKGSSGGSSSTIGPPAVPAPTLPSPLLSPQGGRRLVCARQKPGHGLRPRPPPLRQERRAPGPRAAKLAARQVGSKESSGQNRAAGSPSAEEHRAKTPCYEVSDEEFERLLLAGALGAEADTVEAEDEEAAQVFEISEEEFERLLKAGQLQLAPGAEEQAGTEPAELPSSASEAPRRRLRPRGTASPEVLNGLPIAPGHPKPPSSAPAACRQQSTLTPPPRRRRPQSVDCGREAKVKVGGAGGGLFFLPTDGALAAIAGLWGEAPAAAAAVAIPPAAGSPLQSARLLRGLRASLPQAGAATEGEASASSSSTGVSGEVENHGAFGRRRPRDVAKRDAPGRLPRISQKSLQQSSLASSSLSKGNFAGAKGEDEDFFDAASSSVSLGDFNAGSTATALAGDDRRCPSKKLAPLSC